MKVAELYAVLGIQPDRAQFRRALNEVGGFARSVGRTLGKGALGVNNKLSDAIKGFGASFKNAAVGLLPVASVAAAGAAVVGITKDAIDFDRALTSLDVASKGAVGNLDEFRARALQVSRDTGVAKEALVSGASSFVALTGDGMAAKNGMLAFARVAKATGADMGEIAGAAASLSQQLQIAPEDMEQAFSILVAGGKEGAVELKDFAGLLPSLGAQFKQFGLTGKAGVAQLGAAFQTVRTDFGSAGEAATGLQALFQSLMSKRTVERLKDSGIQTMTKDAETGEYKLRDFQAIMNDIFNSKLVQDPTKLSEAFGREEAVKAINALRNNRDGWAEMAQKTMTAKDIAEDYARVQESSSARIDKALNALKVRFAEVLTPERIETLADAFESVIETVSRLVDWLERLDKWLPEKRHSFKEWALDLPGQKWAAKNVPGFLEGMDPESQQIMRSMINAEKEGREYSRPIITRERGGKVVETSNWADTSKKDQWGRAKGEAVTTVNIYATPKAGVTAEQIGKKVKEAIESERRKLQ